MKKRISNAIIGRALLIVGMIIMVINLVILKEYNAWVLAAQLFFIVCGSVIIGTELRQKRKESKTNKDI